MTSAAVSVRLPTPYGVFDAHAFERPSGFVYVALVIGDVQDADGVLVRVHSECLTGDVLGSLRCDCGVQLRQSLRMIAAERQGVLIYATGHEGRGIGLVNKLRAYLQQDAGADTVDANHALGLPTDLRRYDDAAAVIATLGVRSVRLLTNNPHKVRSLRAAGTVIDSVVPLATAPHHRNAGYLSTKAARMAHRQPAGPPLEVNPGVAVDVLGLLGSTRPPADRPKIVLKYAQSVDGRISTATGDARWISGEPERRVSHALRASCDGVLVGVGTVVQDDPQLTVRMVPGASPVRVVLDSTLRLPPDARVLDDDATTIIVTTERSDPERRAELRRRGVAVEVVATDHGRIALADALGRLRSLGLEVVMVEGGAEVITGLLQAGLVDRLVVAVAPIVIGSGTSAVEALGTTRIADAIQLCNRSIVPVGDDVLLAWDVAASASAPPSM
jgi:3,4-dihydroxy 2-butanone 4-phosphate synthase/GTP cyclohydrolase II